MTQDRKDLNDLVKSLGEPSLLILQVLDPARPLPGIEILRRVEAILEAAGDPDPRLDPSTLHYALKRMENDGLVKCEGTRTVDVPGPRGSVRQAERPVYVITGLGADALEAALARQWRLREATKQVGRWVPGHGLA